MMIKQITLAIAAGLSLLCPSQALFAQEAIPACSTQQELEQVVESDGTITPDGCRSVVVSSLESDGMRLCLIDFAANESGIVDRLVEVAAPSQWWVRCDLLAAALQ